MGPGLTGTGIPSTNTLGVPATPRAIALWVTNDGHGRSSASPVDSSPVELWRRPMSRSICPVLAAKVVSAEEAVAHIHDGDNVGFSGFTGAGYPKAVPAALAATMIRAHDEGRQFQVGLWTGASTAPDADGVLAAAYGISTRLPYNSDPTLRGMINAGHVRYIDAHLSHAAQHMWFGFYGKLDVAVVEVTAALGDGLLVPSTSVGNNKTWLDQAERVILEVNHWQPRELEGFHDIYYGTALPPSRRPIML